MEATDNTELVHLPGKLERQEKEDITTRGSADDTGIVIFDFVPEKTRNEGGKRKRQSKR
jgi:hypothetical protein